MNIYLLNIKKIKPDDIKSERLFEAYREKFLRLLPAAPEKAVQTAIAAEIISYIKKEYGVLSDLKITDKGKPHFENSEISFSVSHSKDVVAVCASEKNCGLDVQVFTLPNQKTVESVLNDLELNEFNALTDEYEKTKLFTRFFTEKESYVKFSGEGFIKKPCEIKSYPGVKFLTKYLFISSDVYCLTICAENIERVSYKVLTKEMLGL